MVPSGTNPSVATLSGIFKDKKVTSDVVVTINCATYGSGTNPKAQTFTFYTTTDCSSQISATQSGKLPTTSSSYTSPIYTISKEDATSLLNDLAIKITKTGRQIRLKSIGVKFSYEAASAASLTSIAVSGTPTKATYKEGEAFDPTGLVVTATYDDESTKVVTDDVKWACTPETLTLGITEVNVTASYGEKTASKTVAVTVTEVQEYNVTWNVNGKVYTEGAPTTEVVEGEKVEVLPTAPASIGGLVFMGWTNEAVTSQDAAPDVLFTSAADAPAVTSDVTYYAVFAIQSGSMKWKKVSLANVDEGIYALITPDGHAFNGEIEKAGHGKATADAFVFDKDVATSAPEGTLEIILSAKAGGYTMFNADKGYLYARDAKSGNLAWGTKESSNWHYKEGKEGKEDNWLCSNNAYLRCYENTFRTYGSGIYDSISFVKKVSDISYSNYTTTAETLPLRAFDGKNYFATFSSDKAVKFVDATVFTVDVENGTISLNEIASKQVPANTGVLLRSTKESDVFTYIESAPAIEGTNLLKPASEKMTEGFKFYKLAYDNYTEKTGLGFYWGAAEGGAFTVKPGLAYLAQHALPVREGRNSAAVHRCH